MRPDLSKLALCWSPLKWKLEVTTSLGRGGGQRGEFSKTLRLQTQASSETELGVPLQAEWECGGNSVLQKTRLLHLLAHSSSVPGTTRGAGGQGVHGHVGGWGGGVADVVRQLVPGRIHSLQAAKRRSVYSGTRRMGGSQTCHKWGAAISRRPYSRCKCPVALWTSMLKAQTSVKYQEN